MTFKEWLLTEHGGGSASAGEFFYKLSLYPTDGFDGAEAFIDPRDVWALQGRRRIETKEGRKFHNLKKDDYIGKKFTSVQSLTMPDQKKWKHSKDDKPDIKVYFYNDMNYMGVKKTDASKPNILTHKMTDYGLPLDSIFGDTVKERGDIPKDFDKPFKKVYENLTTYQDVGPTRTANTHMGVASKYVGPDETGEKDQEETPIADFGFDKPNPYLQKHQQRAYIQSKLRRRNGISQSHNHVQGQPDPGSDQHPAP